MYKWLILVLFPLLLGLLLYACFAPSGNWIEGLIRGFKSPFPQYAFLSYQLPDGLWSLSFVNAMMLWWWNEKKWMRMTAVSIAFVSGPCIEFLQLNNVLNGTFDWVDIGVELSFCCISLYKTYLKK